MTPEHWSEIVWHSLVPLLWAGMFIALIVTSAKSTIRGKMPWKRRLKK